MKSRSSKRWIPALVVIVAALVAAAVLWSPWGGDDGDDQRQAAAQPSPADVQTLVSRPELDPPAVAVERAPARPSENVILVSPRIEDRARDAAAYQQGAFMLDELGRTRWFRPASDGEPVTDLRVQRYRGEPVLTWWQGAASQFGIGRGHGVIVDERYRRIAEVQAGNGKTIDLHDFVLTDRGTALVTIYSRARRDLTAVGGERNAQVTQGIVQEIDVESGEVLLEWESLDEIAPTESYRPIDKPKQDSYDYFHINSVAEDVDGHLLVSARHTHGIYKINRRTGKLMWRLGGKKSDFELGPGAEFGLQHDARPLGRNVIQLFDNAAQVEDGAQTASSVKRLRLDTRRMRATLVQRFDNPNGEWAESQGNAHAQPGGGVMVGWGSTGAFSLFDGGGDLLFSARLPARYDSYRAYRAPWTGRPPSRPAIHARREKEQVQVAASWNGSTEVAAWRVLAGPRRNALRPVGSPMPWNGLETRIIRATPQRFVAVAALDARGRPLRRSAVRDVGTPPPRP